MNDQTSSGHVQNPILDDGGAGIQRGLCGEIESQCCVGNFHDKLEVGGLGIPGNDGRKRAVQDDQIGLRFIKPVIARTNIYWGFSIHEVRFKNLL